MGILVEHSQRQVPCGNEVIDAVYDFFLFKHFKQINFISCRITSISVILSKVVDVCCVIFFHIRRKRIFNDFSLERRVALKPITINHGITDN